MTKMNRVTRSESIAVIIWSNILRHQYLEGWSNDKLRTVLDIAPRTYYNYQHDPSNLTLKQIQAVMDELDLKMEDLLME